MNVLLFFCFCAFPSTFRIHHSRGGIIELSKEKQKNANQYILYVCVWRRRFNFSSLSLDTLISQNKKRLQYSDGLHYVPEQVIRGIYQKMEPIPKGIYTIDATKSDAEEKFWNIWE